MIKSYIKNLFIVLSILATIPIVNLIKNIDFSQEDTINVSYPIIGDSKISEWAYNCDSPCILPDEFRLGGVVINFLQAAHILKQENKSLYILNASCVSACSILMDELHYMNSPVCVSEHTQIGIHRGSKLNNETQKIDSYFDYQYRNRILMIYIDSIGGLDEFGAISYFKASTLASFIPVCKEPPMQYSAALRW